MSGAGQTELESRLRRLARNDVVPAHHQILLLNAADAIAEIAEEHEDFKRRLGMIEPIADVTPFPITWEDREPIDRQCHRCPHTARQHTAWWDIGGAESNGGPSCGMACNVKGCRCDDLE